MFEPTAKDLAMFNRVLQSVKVKNEPALANPTPPPTATASIAGQVSSNPIPPSTAAASQPAESVTTPTPETTPSNAHPSVERCMQAYTQAYNADYATRQTNFYAEKEGRKAYVKAMPSLVGRSNIREFIACVSNAMLLEVIPSTEGTKLLYAAQIAYNTTAHLKRVKKTNGSTPKTTTLSEPSLQQAF